MGNFNDYFEKVNITYNSLNPRFGSRTKTPERNCEILKGCLFSDKTQGQIAKEHGLSRIRIAQILHSFLRRMRKYESVIVKD